MQEDIKKFWSINPETGKLMPEILDMYDFLQSKGFRKRTIEDELEIYKQNGYIVEQCYTPDQINEIQTFLKTYKEKESITIEYQRKDDVTFTYSSKDILEKIIKYGWSKIFNQNNWNHFPELKVDIKRHTRDKAFFYFKNGFVEVTAKDIKLHNYDLLQGYIYKDYLIDKPISIVDPDDGAVRDFAPRGVDFLNFLSKVSGCIDANPTEAQKEKLLYLMKLIGFLLHEYRQQGLTDYCVIFCDDNVGGSGKGVIVQALKQMTALCLLDAKKEERFDPDNLTERTRIKVVNDIPHDFLFAPYYNEITDGGTIRHIYGAPREVPYADLWKLLITSNFIVRGNSGADMRRQRVFSFENFFDRHNTVQGYYKQSFFSTDWSATDWNYFYNLMFQCVQYWLASEYKVDYTDTVYEQRKMEAEFPMEFRAYIEALERKAWHKTGDLYWNFKNHERYKLTPFVKRLTPQFFATMLKRYCDETGTIYKKNHNRTEIYLGESPSKPSSNTQEATQENIPFK